MDVTEPAPATETSPAPTRTRNWPFYTGAVIATSLAPWLPGSTLGMLVAFGLPVALVGIALKRRATYRRAAGLRASVASLWIFPGTVSLACLVVVSVVAVSFHQHVVAPKKLFSWSEKGYAMFMTSCVDGDSRSQQYCHCVVDGLQYVISAEALGAMNGGKGDQVSASFWQLFIVNDRTNSLWLTCQGVPTGVAAAVNAR